MPLSNKEIALGDVLSLLLEGLKISLSKPYRAYTIIPICINLVLLSLGAYFLISYINEYIFSLFVNWPDFLIYLAYFISIFVAISVVFASCYFFSTIATIIASPFYGMLAQKLEENMTGKMVNDDGLVDILKDLPRIFKREAQKQLYFIPRALLCLVILFIPVVNVIFPVLWLLLTATMAAIQYCDYAYDNHKTAFAFMREDLKSHRLSSFIFGFCVSFALAIPIVNLFVPASAVCAGTIYYLKIQKLKEA